MKIEQFRMKRPRGRAPVWRLYLLSAILGAAVVAWIASWDVSRYYTGEKTMTLRLTHGALKGREAGERSWEITARELIISEDGDRIDVFGIERGVVFRDDEPAYFITAASAVYHERTEDLNIQGPIVVTSAEGDRLETSSMQYRAQIKKLIFPEPLTFDFATANFLKADYMEASRELEVLDARGAVELQITDFTTPSAVRTEKALLDEGYEPDDMEIIHLAAQRVVYDKKKGIIDLMPAVRETEGRADPDAVVAFRQDEYLLTGGRMKVYKDDKMVVAERGVTLVREGGPVAEEQRGRRSRLVVALMEHDTLIESESTVFNWEREEAVLSRRVKVTQAADAKTLTADSGRFRGRDNIINLESAVRIEMESVRWIADVGLFNDPESGEAEEYWDEPTVIRAERVELDSETGDLSAWGEVRIEQPHSLVMADKVVRDGHRDDWDISGRVMIRNREGEWLTADSVRHHGEQNATRLSGGVKMQFKMPPEYADELDGFDDR